MHISVFKKRQLLLSLGHLPSIWLPPGREVSLNGTHPILLARNLEVILEFPFLSSLTFSHSCLPICPVNTDISHNLSSSLHTQAKDLVQVLVISLSHRKGLLPNSCSCFSSALSSRLLPEPAPSQT